VPDHRGQMLEHIRRHFKAVMRRLEMLRRSFRKLALVILRLREPRAERRLLLARAREDQPRIDPTRKPEAERHVRDHAPLDSSAEMFNARRFKSLRSLVFLHTGFEAPPALILNRAILCPRKMPGRQFLDILESRARRGDIPER